MPKAYSLDLRERVAGFVEAGHSRRAAAGHFEVSVSFVVKLIAALGLSGRLDPKPAGGRRHAKLEPHRALAIRREMPRGSGTILCQQLSDDRLVRLSALSVPATFPYYLISAPERVTSPAVAALERWILDHFSALEAKK